MLPACSAASSKPVVVIASPPSGSQYKEGDDVAIQSTSSCEWPGAHRPEARKQA
jgi:hypothetical protein